VRLGMKGAMAATVVVLAAAFPASGQLTFDGVCTMNATFTFSGPITNTSPPRSWSMFGTGTCVTDAQPLSPIKSMSLGGSGVSQLTQCGVMRLLGSYAASWDPSPAPPASSGALDFIGSAAAGVLHLSAPSPQFQGLGVVASIGGLGCALGGTSQLTFTGALLFVDP
jgi:hypothetical protein